MSPSPKLSPPMYLYLILIDLDMRGKKKKKIKHVRFNFFQVIGWLSHNSHYLLQSNKSYVLASEALR